MADDTKGTNIIYTVVKEALAIQQKQKETLETKASTLIAFAGGIFALLMGARDTLITLSSFSQYLLMISIGLFAISVILANLVTWVTTYRADPNPETLAEEYLNLTPQKIQLQLIRNMVNGWKANHELLERKANYLRFTFVIQAIAFCFLGIALLWTIA